MIKKTFFLLMIVSGSLFAAEQKSSTNDDVTIFGASELPAAVDIAPWHTDTSMPVADMKIETLLDEELQPIERQEFRRKMEIFQQSNLQ